MDERGRVDRPSREFRGEIFRRFFEALEPLRREGKLGGILFQFPSYVVPKERSHDYLRWAREQVGDHEMLVEFVLKRANACSASPASSRSGPATSRSSSSG